MSFDRIFTELKLKLIKRCKYNYIIPIGEGCYSAQVLKDNNMRVFSGPFDWVRTPNYMASVDLLKNDFKNYLNKDDLKYFQTFDSRQEDWYINKRTKIIYRHEFKANTSADYDKYYTDVYEKYKRRCSRLLDVINDKKCNKVCLLYIERADAAENTEPIPDKINNIQLQNEIDALNKHFKKECFDIFYFKHEPKFNRYKFKINGKICRLNNSYFAKNPDILPSWGNYEIVSRIIQKRFSAKRNLLYKLKLLLKYYQNAV